MGVRRWEPLKTRAHSLEFSASSQQRLSLVGRWEARGSRPIQASVSAGRTVRTQGIKRWRRTVNTVIYVFHTPRVSGEEEDEEEEETG